MSLARWAGRGRVEGQWVGGARIATRSSQPIPPTHRDKLMELAEVKDDMYTLQGLEMITDYNGLDRQHGGVGHMGSSRLDEKSGW